MENKCDNCSKVYWLEEELKEKKKEISELENNNEALLQEVRRLRSVVRTLNEKK